MSKAFTKETDDVPEAPPRRRGIPVPELNMVTPAGHAAARAELDLLARTGGDADRIRELTDHLATAQIATPPADRSAVALGARVGVDDETGARHVYEIVGAIEQDPRRGRIGWQSPLAQALWGARVGDTVALPRGECEVRTIDYPDGDTLPTGGTHGI